MERRFVVVAHHEETCGGLVLQWLKDLGHLTIVRPLQGQALPSLEGVSGVVLLGSHHGVNDPVEGLAEERRWVERALATDVPVFGICFGAQLLAQIGGSPVVRAQRPERGVHPVNLVCSSGLPKERLDVMQWHQDCIARLPAGARWLAKGEGEHEVQAFALGSAAGVQFHPETTAAMLERWSRLPAAPAQCQDWHQALEKLHPMRAWAHAFLVNHFTTSRVPARLPGPAFAGRLR
jgi:GMP synthase (glutamine-hydrolysing)